MDVHPRLDATRLTDFATAVYADAGLPEAEARLVADTLVQADLWGHQSHGVLRLGWYLDRLRQGVMHPVTTPEIVVDAGAIAVLDGHDGVGQVLAMRATHEAITRARWCVSLVGHPHYTGQIPMDVRGPSPKLVHYPPATDGAGVI